MKIVRVLSLPSSKTVMVVIAVTLLWVSSDVNERLFQHRQQNGQNVNRADVKVMMLPSVTTKTLAEIKQRYEKYRQASAEKTPAEMAITMSMEEQAKQTGELKTVFIGNKKLALKAVLSIISIEKTINRTKKSTQSVLFQITDSESNTAVIEKFTNLAMVYGFQLKVINNTQVQLTKQNYGQQQKIILTMYTPSTKTKTKK